MSWPGGGMPPGWDMMGHNMGQPNPNQNQNPGAHPSANPYAGYGQQQPGMPPGYGSQPGYPPSQGYSGYPGQGQPSYGGQQPPGAGYPGMPGMNPQQSMGQHGWEHGMGQMMPGYPGHPGHPQYGQQKAPGRPSMSQNPMCSAANYGAAQQQLHQSQQQQSSGKIFKASDSSYIIFKGIQMLHRYMVKQWQRLRLTRVVVKRQVKLDQHRPQYLHLQ